MKLAVFALLALLSTSCKTIMDTSMAASDAGDYTLLHSACHAQPGQGIDACRVFENAKNEETWVLVMPKDKKVISGEITVRYKGTKKSYAVTENTVVIPWKEITGHDVWLAADDGIAQATGAVKFKGPTGEEWADVLGIAFVIVLQPGYTPLPIDSGDAQWSATCAVRYTTKGRSAIECSK